MTDAEIEYEKEVVLVHFADTSSPGLYVVEAASKIFLNKAVDGETEGDDDEVVVQYAILLINPESKLAA